MTRAAQSLPILDGVPRPAAANRDDVVGDGRGDNDARVATIRVLADAAVASENQVTPAAVLDPVAAGGRGAAADLDLAGVGGAAG